MVISPGLVLPEGRPANFIQRGWHRKINIPVSVPHEVDCGRSGARAPRRFAGNFRGVAGFR
jgi:hypothetical protein